jgi:regulator of sigma E protease
MVTVFAFLVAIGLLVAVHEFGHFSMARACGVKVLRFSVGFGPRIAGWTSLRSGTEYVVGMLPLGGYVKMLDEREGLVEAGERHLALNTQALHKRAAIVVAGPLANLLLAVLLYACVYWSGLQQSSPIVASPVSGSLAQKAGLAGGEQVVSACFDGDEPIAVQSFEDLRWWITRAALQQQDLRLEFKSASGHSNRSIILTTASLVSRQADMAMFRHVGLLAPFSSAELGEITPDGAAQDAGLRSGDRVLAVDGNAIIDAMQLRELIRKSGADLAPGSQARAQNWRLMRQGVATDIVLQPRLVRTADGVIGRIGAVVGSPPSTVVLHYGFWDGLRMGVQHTWQVSHLSLTMLAQILTGEASVKNLSGPITIADYAGQSAAMGLTPFLVFLALVSVSLGVLNLLPLPVLDGGHLVYYLWEWLSGRPVSDFWMDHLQRAGVAVLFLMMSIAVFNDVTRLIG